MTTKSPLPFTIDVGQFWKKDGEVWHVPRVEKDLPHHCWEVIRCTMTPTGYQWVFPREPDDQPTWCLADFQEAALVE